MCKLFSFERFFYVSDHRETSYSPLYDQKSGSSLCSLCNLAAIAKAKAKVKAKAKAKGINYISTVNTSVLRLAVRQCHPHKTPLMNIWRSTLAMPSWSTMASFTPLPYPILLLHSFARDILALDLAL
jgi:hypothetical protein